jgi:fibronectin-binding autotransporter adhesin
MTPARRSRRGATLYVGGQSPLINGLQGSGSVTNSGAAVTLTVQNGNFGGTISGPIALTVSGDLALTGTNTYTRGTTINTLGELTLGNRRTTGSVPGNIVDNGTIEFRLTSTSVESGTISGTGNLVQSGSGTTVLSTSNSYSGGTLLDGGTLELEKPNSAGTGVITFLNGSPETLQIDGTTMPSNLITGFSGLDPIDLRGISAMERATRAAS